MSGDYQHTHQSPRNTPLSNLSNPVPALIQELNEDAEHLQNELLNGAANLLRLYQQQSSVRTARTNEQDTYDYMVSELRMEQNALYESSRPAKKSAAKESAEVSPVPDTPKSVMTAGTAKERDEQFDFFIVSFIRSNPLTPLARSAKTLAELKQEEDSIKLQIEQSEKSLSAKRVVAELISARLLALSKIV